MPSNETTTLRTPLYDLHVELGGKMVPFAGYSLPVQYPSGIIKEHNHTREAAGLFDVSHMGQIRLWGDGAAAALESVVPVDIVGLPASHQRYALFTNEAGGILDDLIITNAGDHLFLVLNAACKEQDTAHLRAHLAGSCEIEEVAGQALLALQGPAAGAVMARLAPATAEMVFMTAGRHELAGASCFVTRSGYTGEDGFEISVPDSHAEALARALLEQPEVAAIGLGARDSLRLEAGLCLYGQDIDTTTTPVEAALNWALSKARRADGARPGGYPGADVILGHLAEGAGRKRVGLAPQGRMPVREGVELADGEGRVIGKVTSGVFGPTLGAPVAMGYVELAFAKPDTEIQALVRGKAHQIKVAKMPFVQQRYYRG